MKKMMMLMVFLVSAVLAFSATKGSEKPIPFEKLPKMAQEFIHTHFKGVKVVKCEVESPWTQFDVRMANGYDLIGLEIGLRSRKKRAAFLHRY
mgnify:CR=1 FL=1